ncbi:MAG: glutamine--fructose-6-phosphate transaminase (isomerizing) [Eubacteriales bacterium]|nr:glutamine--fructose-6-phosphate transaminase (isomerizing) [Eubacteriales bacterium]
MCGIVGYTGFEEAGNIIIEGLKRLEYRGYDSAGVAVNGNDGISMVKTRGKVEVLESKVRENGGLSGHSGIGHTRWATHGQPSDVNAHPHMSESGKFAVVHNGIIENYAELRSELSSKGITFLSETDTEVIVALLEYYYDGNIKKAFMKTVSRLQGSYALGILCADAPGSVFLAKNKSPLIIGIGAGDNYFASDITAFMSYTRNVIDLEDGEFAELKPDEIKVFDCLGRKIEKEERRITWDVSAAEKNGFEHFMLKEIYEQPNALKQTIEPRIKGGRVVLDDIELNLKDINRIVVTACGSAYHAGYAGKYIIEKLCRINTEVELASEIRYRDFVMDEHTLVIVISQSGETADTIAAMKECKGHGAKVFAICNVVGSTVAKLADYVLYTWAGPEIAVATTKGYTTQLAAMTLFAVWGASQLGMINEETEREQTDELLRLPAVAQRTLDLNTSVMELAAKYHEMKSLFFIGRNLDYCVALEGSLKLKEISYIHSEAYAAGELKHGTIALIEPGRLVIALCCYNRLFEKTMSNIEQVKARGANVLAVADVENKKVISEADEALLIPKVNEFFFPILEIIPLQLFAYYVAKENGCDIDKPKNLAKSVTVE